MRRNLSDVGSGAGLGDPAQHAYACAVFISLGHACKLLVRVRHGRVALKQDSKTQQNAASLSRVRLRQVQSEACAE